MKVSGRFRGSSKNIPAILVIIVFGHLFATPLFLLRQFIWLVVIHDVIGEGGGD